MLPFFLGGLKKAHGIVEHCLGCEWDLAAGVSTHPCIDIIV